MREDGPRVQQPEWVKASARSIGTGKAELEAAASRVRLWLFEQAFPFWADVGVDRQGPGFVEHLTLDGTPAEVDYKRVRVQARQVFAFSQAALLGWPGDACGPAARAVDLLLDRAWLGADAGWASVLARSGEVRDSTADLYDIAFVLFALGWWAKVASDTRVLPIALQTLDFLNERMRHPSGEGYLHRLGGIAPHLQNPHMHLLEAMLALHQATGHERFAAEADRLVHLGLRRFVDVPSGTLAETFDDTWQRRPGAAGLLLEPGHHYEWVWLLDQYLAQRPVEQGPVVEAMQALFGFASSPGQAPSGLVFDSVLGDGTVTGPNHRLWPQAERLKAWIAMNSRCGTEADAVVAEGTRQIFDVYLETEPKGTWIEHRDRQHRPTADRIPASSFYHVVLAFAEVLAFARRRHASR